MIQRLIESFFNWIIDLSSIEENFEVSNRNLTRLMWQRYRIVFLFLIIFSLLFTWYIIAIQNGDVQFQTEGRKIRHFLLSVTVVFAALWAIGYFIWEWIRLFRNRRILFQTYPELDNELANLAEADYID